jgi:taurine dioxygenase
MTFARIAVEPLAGALGAEIAGVDLARVSDDTVCEIRRAWLEHLVVFFRDQSLAPDEFLAFARRLGEPVEYPFVNGIEDYPEIIAVTKLITAMAGPKYQPSPVEVPVGR